MSCGSIIIYLLACFAFLWSSTKSQQITSDLFAAANHSRKVGESCERDIHCIAHAFCRHQMTCLCDEFYAPSLDKVSCHVTVGASCFAPDACSSMANAECRQSVCTCKDNFMIDINNSSNCIIRPTRPDHLCQRNDDCSDSMEMAYCINNKCACYSDHRFVNETGTCLKVRGLYQPCKKNYECFLDGKNSRALECRKGECACREGEANCNKGSPTHQSFLIVFTTFVFGTVNRMLT